MIIHSLHGNDNINNDNINNDNINNDNINNNNSYCSDKVSRFAVEGDAMNSSPVRCIREACLLKFFKLS